jgi:hypothetical protein
VTVTVCAVDGVGLPTDGLPESTRRTVCRSHWDGNNPPWSDGNILGNNPPWSKVMSSNHRDDGSNPPGLVANK